MYLLLDCDSFWQFLPGSIVGQQGFSVMILNCLQDTCNRKSNQQNLGTIKSSNLCTEIIEFTSPTETAVCNLASIALPRFVREKVFLVSASAVQS
jgi:hypothetical protein